VVGIRRFAPQAEKRKGDVIGDWRSFDMTDRTGLLKGGDNDVDVLSGKSRESLLYKLVSHQQTPDEQDKLPDASIEQIAQWIDFGAPCDRPLKGAAKGWSIFNDFHDWNNECLNQFNIAFRLVPGTSAKGRIHLDLMFGSRFPLRPNWICTGHWDSKESSFTTTTWSKTLMT
jgi:hypothetical protein